MREEQGPLQALKYASALADRPSAQTLPNFYSSHIRGYSTQACPPSLKRGRKSFDSSTPFVVHFVGFGGNWRLASCIKYLCDYRRGHGGRGLRIRERAQKKVLIIRSNVGYEKSRRGVLTRPLCAWDPSICAARADKGEEA